MPHKPKREHLLWTLNGKRGPIRLTLIEDQHGKSVDLRRWFNTGDAIKATQSGVRIRAADDVDGLVQALRVALEAMGKASDR